MTIGSNVVSISLKLYIDWLTLMETVFLWTKLLHGDTTPNQWETQARDTTREATSSPIWWNLVPFGSRCFPLKFVSKDILKIIDSIHYKINWSTKICHEFLMLTTGVLYCIHFISYQLCCNKGRIDGLMQGRHNFIANTLEFSYFLH